MRLRDYRSWLAGSTVCFVLLGFTAGICPAQSPESDKPAAKADAKKPSIYDKNADAKEQLTAATARAERSNKRVLLMFGGDWCGWCHKLHDLFAQNADIRRLLSYEYELVMVDTKAPHAPELLQECSKGQTGVGLPVPGRDGRRPASCWSGRRPTRSRRETTTTPRRSRNSSPAGWPSPRTPVSSSKTP